MSKGSGLFTDQRAARPHLVRGGGGVAGEVADLRADVADEMEAMAAIAVEEFIDPPAADVDAFKASIASAATEEVYEGADLDGAVGEGVLDPPRNPTVTTSAHADIDAVTVVFEGKDINGDDISVNVLLTDGGCGSARQRLQDHGSSPVRSRWSPRVRVRRRHRAGQAPGFPRRRRGCRDGDRGWHRAGCRCHHWHLRRCRHQCPERHLRAGDSAGRNQRLRGLLRVGRG